MQIIAISSDKRHILVKTEKDSGYIEDKQTGAKTDEKSIVSLLSANIDWEDPEEDYQLEEEKPKNSQATALLSGWLENQRRGYHTDNGKFPEHPVRVVDHQKWFSTLSSESIVERVLEEIPAKLLEDFIHGFRDGQDLKYTDALDILTKVYGLDLKSISYFEELMDHWTNGGREMMPLNNIVRGWLNLGKKDPLLNAIYDFTQRALYAKYPSGKMKLYRGLTGKIAKDLFLSPIDNVEIKNKKNWVLSSWSGSEEKATQFANWTHTPVRHGKNHGAVIEMEIPIENVFLGENWPSQEGMVNEMETIVMGAENFPAKIVNSFEVYED